MRYPVALWHHVGGVVILVMRYLLDVVLELIGCVRYHLPFQIPLSLTLLSKIRCCSNRRTPATRDRQPLVSHECMPVDVSSCVFTYMYASVVTSAVLSDAADSSDCRTDASRPCDLDPEAVMQVHPIECKCIHG